MAVEGIFVTVELEGVLGKRIHAHQLAFDPKMANYLPPHVTLIGSSGAGPIPADTPLAELKAKIGAVAAATPPIPLRFGPPERFVQREIVSLPLDPHGPIVLDLGAGVPHPESFQRGSPDRRVGAVDALDLHRADIDAGEAALPHQRRVAEHPTTGRLHVDVGWLGAATLA